MGGTEARQAILETLQALEVFGGLPPTVIAELAQRARLDEVQAGHRLMYEGEQGNCAHLVVGGRFMAHTGPNEVPLGEIGRGELVGEMALMTGEPRTASVTALRDSTVLTIDSTDFAEVLGEHPQALRLVNGQLVRRLQAVIEGRERPERATVLTVVTGGRPASREFIDDLAAALSEVDSGLVCQRSVNQIEDLAGLERENDVVLLTCELSDPRAEWACRQSDRVVLVLDASQSVRSIDLPECVKGDRSVLVLVHPWATDLPSGTQAWLDRTRVRNHHHVRSGDQGDASRVARTLLGHKVVLVLGGGGARGIAHVGVLRALLERDIEFDEVWGASAGSLIAAHAARDLDADEIELVTLDKLVEAGSPIDPTLPRVALAKGAKLGERLRDVFGESTRIEDLWKTFRCLSTNLTTADVHVHDSGLLWRAVRASVAIPGVFPPMAEPEGLLVDGGLLDNLPVARARRESGARTIIASDVGRRIELMPDRFPGDGVVSGWSLKGLRARRRPSLVGLLTGLTALGGAGVPSEAGDIHIDHELPGIGLFDFANGAEIIEQGYRNAVTGLDAIDLRSVSDT